MNKLPVIGITMGDPAGIGPEIILRFFNDNKIKIPAKLAVIGDAGQLEKTRDNLRINVDIKKIDKADESSEYMEQDKTVYVIDLDNAPASLQVGVPASAAGKASAEYIVKAVNLAKSKQIDALTTCPISKEAINLAGFHYAGHTEMLGDLTETSNYAMMLSGGNINVVLVTTHMAIKDIARNITKETVLRIIRLTHNVFKQWHSSTPRIGVAALNPHAGEGGLFGDEEIKALIPAIKIAVNEGITVKGPFPADSLFSDEKRKKFDVIVVMYHDQGLIPIKMAAFGKAVNVTLGLPFIRTSVDHGTAFDIAGKGMANPSSLVEALSLAAAMV